VSWVHAGSVVIEQRTVLQFPQSVAVRRCSHPLLSVVHPPLSVSKSS